MNLIRMTGGAGLVARRHAVALLAVLPLALGGACSNNDEPDPFQPRGDFGLLRVINATADTARANRLTVRVESQTVPVIGGLAYQAATPYVTVYIGTRKLEVVKLATGAPVLEASVTVEAAKAYTVLVAGPLGGTIAPIILIDDRSAPAAGRVRFRAVNASPAAGRVDVYVTAANVDLATVSPTFAGVAVGAASAYTTLAAGSYLVRFTAAGSKTVLPGGTFAAAAYASGAVRTFALFDKPGGGTPLETQAFVVR